MAEQPEKTTGPATSTESRQVSCAALHSPVARLVAVLWIAMSTTGCTSLGDWYRNGFKVGPDYCRPDAPVAQRWIDTDSRELDSTREDDARWWRVFNDPCLDALMQELQGQNLDLHAAAMRVEQARAMRSIAAGTLWPQSQEMVGRYQRSATSYNTTFGSIPQFPNFDSDWFLGFDAAWELDFWGRIRRAVEASDANLAMQNDLYNATLVLLQAELAANYVQMRTLEERLMLAHHNVKLQTETIRIIQQRFDQGMVSDLDLRQAKAELAITESIIPAVEAGRRRTQNRICVILGCPPQEFPSFLVGNASIPTPPPSIGVGVPAQLLTRRPDVRAAEQALAAQSAKIGIATAELYPRIAITGTIGLQSQNFDDLFRLDSLSGAVGPAFSWNLLNYGRISNNIRLERARFAELCYNYRNTVLLANEEVENGLVDYLREQNRAQSLGTAVSETEAAVRLALLQYQEGLIDYQRVLDTQRGLVVQQDAHAETRGKVSLHLVSVYKALGGGWRSRHEPDMLTDQPYIP